MKRKHQSIEQEQSNDESGVESQQKPIKQKQKQEEKEIPKINVEDAKSTQNQQSQPKTPVFELSQFLEKFKKQDVELDQMTEADLAELGLTIGERKAIMEAIENRKTKLNWSSSDSFLKSLEQICAEQGFHLKKDFRVPQNTLNKEEQGVLPNCPIELTERDFWVRIAQSMPYRRSSDHPMIAFWAAPGSGKTWTLNHLARMANNERERINKIIDDDNKKNRLLTLKIDKPFVFVQINFKDRSFIPPGTKGAKGQVELDPQVAFDLRFFYSAFFDETKTSFADVQARFQDHLNTVQVARLPLLVRFFNQILSTKYGDQKFQIVVSIDEIKNIGIEDVIFQVLLTCNRIMHNYTNVWVVVTSSEKTDLVNIQCGRTGNSPDRPVPLVRLYPPTMQERLKMFSKFQGFKDLELLLVYSGGHFRTLDVIFKTLSLSPGWNISMANKILEDPLLRKSGTSLSTQTWCELVRLALKAILVHPEYTVPGTTPPIKIHEMVGLVPLLNSPNSLSSFVPRLSILQLLSWSNQTPATDYFKTKVDNVLNYYRHLRDSDNKGKTFEKFHAHWEVLQNSLNSGDVPTSLYHGLSSLARFLSSFQIPLRPKVSDDQLKRLTIARTRLQRFCSERLVSYSKSVVDDFVSIEETMKKEAVQDRSINETNEKEIWRNFTRFKYVFLPKNQDYPFLDIVSFFQTDKKGVYVVIQQTKYRYDVEHSEVKFTDIHPRKKVLEAFEKLFPDQKIPEQNIFFAFTVWRHIPASVAVRLVAPDFSRETTIQSNYPNQRHVDFVCGLPELRESYGPTLESVGWFLGKDLDFTDGDNEHNSFLKHSKEEIEVDDED